MILISKDLVMIGHSHSAITLIEVSKRELRQVFFKELDFRKEIIQIVSTGKKSEFLLLMKDLILLGKVKRNKF
jgi:hypothetical protein